MGMVWLALQLVALCVISLIHLIYAETREVCDAETFEGRCESGQVMVMKAARYGRMRLGRCVKVDLGYLGCSSDVLPLFDEWCSGKPSCDVFISNANDDLVEKRTCIADVMSYLEVDFSCANVMTAREATCRSGTGTTVTGTLGTLSSYVTEETGCGSFVSPWLIHTLPGQRVSVSMIDFGLEGDIDAPSQTRCPTYGFISEPDLGINRTICGGLARERPIYVSSSNNVYIQINPSRGRELKSSFLISYSVTGCPDMTPPTHAWYKRNGSTAVIGCEWSEHSWHLQCEGNTWVGVVGNCSSAVKAKENAPSDQWSMSPLLSVSLIIGLGVLVVALFCIALIGCICIIGNRSKTRGPPRFQPTDQQQAFLYHPGRALPMAHPSQNFTGASSTLQREGGTKSTATDDLIHIWETPLPIPKQAQSSTGVSDNSSTMPGRGTLPGPPQVYKDGSTMSRSDYSTDTYWAGTDRYFDNDLGWVAMPTKE